MLCNQAVSQARLREESISQEMRVGQRYINEDDAPAPSVITLNALGASQAANDFLFYITGLVNDDALGGTIQARPLKRTLCFVPPRRDKTCPDCGSDGRFARGHNALLHVIGGQSIPRRTAFSY